MTYEDRLEERRDRLEAAAAKAEAEAESRFKASMDGLPPMGQPILVGHHSEKRHRAALKRSDNHSRKASEAHDRGKELRSKAAAVGTGGISCDDENAITKIEAKIGALRERQNHMKALNAWWRKHKTMKGAPGVDDAKAARLDAEIPERYSWERQPFPGYNLTNNNANIKRLERRLTDLKTETETRAAGPVEPDVRNGFTFTEHPEENRAWVTFDKKPNKMVTTHMRRFGWKWSPHRIAWVRMLNAAARSSWENFLADEVAKLMEG